MKPNMIFRYESEFFILSLRALCSLISVIFFCLIYVLTLKTI